MSADDPSPTPSGSGRPDVEEPSSRLVREWTACALVRAATRFLPVPLLDDAVAQRATRVAVSRTLRAHGCGYAATAVEPLYAERGGGLLRLLASVPRRVLLYPVRTYTRIAGAVTGVPDDISRVLLLGRAVHRRLALGRLSGQGRELEREAAAVREAFEAVVDDMDLRLLRGAVSDALDQVTDLTGAVVDYARNRFGRAEADDEVPEPEGAVAEGTDRVDRALREPDVARLLAEFDRRMDARLDG